MLDPRAVPAISASSPATTIQATNQSSEAADALQTARSDVANFPVPLLL